VPTFTGKRSGYNVTAVLYDERLDDIYGGGRYPEVYSVKIERSFVGWSRFDVAARNGHGVYVHYIGNNFQQARQALNNVHYQEELKSFKVPMLQEVDRLSEVQGTFIVYEDFATTQPRIAFDVEIDQGYYRAQSIERELKDVDITGLEDLL